MSEQTFTSKSLSGKRPGGFLERMTHELFHAVEHSLYAEKTARVSGLLQNLDPRVKIIGFLALIITAVESQNLWMISTIFLTAVFLALVSRVSLRTVATRVWLSVFLFTGLIAVPAIFVVPGHPIYRIPLLNWAISAQGLRSAAYLISRAETSATLALLLIISTPWTHVLKALRVLRVPVVIVVILGMTHRYIFFMLQTTLDMFQSRRSRLAGKPNRSERRQLAISTAGVLFIKSFERSSDVYMAMRSRGYQGEVYLLDEFKMKLIDWIGLILFLAAASLIIWWG